VGEVVDMSDEDLLKIRNFGERSLSELKEKLAGLNIPSILNPTDESTEDRSQLGVPEVFSDDLSELMGSLEIQDPQSSLDESDQLSEFIPEIADDLDEEEE